jgi:uncharacterized protein YhjY with autotransporter beta-barrel domain
MAMRFSSGDQQSLVGTLGFQMQRAVNTDLCVLLPYLRVHYAHEFEDDPVDLRTSYVLDASASLPLSADEPDTSYITASVGVSTVFPFGWMPFLDVSYWAGYDDLDRLRVQAGLRKEL